MHDSAQFASEEAGFVGVASVDSEIGLGVFNRDEADVKRAMLAGSAQVIALTSADKIGTTAPFLIGPVSVLDHLITETFAPVDQINMIREKQIAVTVV
jgi:DeoR/GlpR family transcriptional regulator of sugar metabolism